VVGVAVAVVVGVGVVVGVSRQVGITKVNLETREDNVAAIRLYESVGFQREGILARAIRIGDRYYADLAMGIALH
jgi:RimJ/RimL family protein N-acetyltransferase